jgi:hypothetical protein
VKTLLDATSKNFAIDKGFRCHTLLEDSEASAKAVVAKLITDKFGELVANAEISKLWPQSTYGVLMNNPVLQLGRTRVKINLIENYFKIYGKQS